jgi:hypothetical protein
MFDALARNNPELRAELELQVRYRRVRDLAGEHLLRLLSDQDLVWSRRDLLAETFLLPDGVGVSLRLEQRSDRFAARPAMVKVDQGLGVGSTPTSWRSCSCDRARCRRSSARVPAAAPGTEKRSRAWPRRECGSSSPMGCFSLRRS